MDPDTQKELLTKVRNLKGDCLTSHKSFLDILQQIKEVSTDQSVTIDMQPVLATRYSQWEGHCSTYIRIIWRSRYIAETAETSAKEFVGLLSRSCTEDLPTPEDMQKLKVTIERDRMRGQELVDSFYELKGDIDLFSKGWSNISSPEEEQDSDVSRKINKVKRALQYVASKLAGMCDAIKRNVSRAACIGSKAMSRYHELEDDGVTNEKHDHVPGPTRDAFDNVTVQISMIMSIWSAIWADMGQVDNFLIDVDGGFKDFNRKRLKNSRETYSFFAEIFREYQIAVANRPTIVRRRRPA